MFAVRPDSPATRSRERSNHRKWPGSIELSELSPAVHPLVDRQAARAAALDLSPSRKRCGDPQARRVNVGFDLERTVPIDVDPRVSHRVSDAFGRRYNDDLFGVELEVLAGGSETRSIEIRAVRPAARIDWAVPNIGRSATWGSSQLRYNGGMSQPPISAKGRGSQINPVNRFTRIEFVEDFEHLERDPDGQAARQAFRTEYFLDNAAGIISENDSPDIPFRYSLNPYRGCSHGCAYCYARPTHEYYDLGAGLDFESKIFVKERAPELFRDWLARDGYQPDSITFSGVTDCYQPIERKLELTRKCLAVALEARQPVAVVTKNALVARDIDILSEMARHQVVSVALSITTLDQSLVRVLEPRTSSPAGKLGAVERLAAAGVPTHVLIAPVIPGLTDHEIPGILQRAKDAGASSAGYILLRLPLCVEPIFLEWLRRTQPDRAAKVESRIRATRGGKLYESGYGTRMRGRGEHADQIKRTFQLFARRLELLHDRAPLSAAHFRPPVPTSGQKWLFDE